MGLGFLLIALAGWSVAAWLLWLRASDAIRERDFYRNELHVRVGVRALPVPVPSSKPVKPEVKPATMEDEGSTPLPLSYLRSLRVGWSATDLQIYDEHNQLSADSALPKDEITLLQEWVAKYGSMRPSQVYAEGSQYLI